jgi:hypothetical protein
VIPFSLDPLVLVIGRDEVEAGEVTRMYELLSSLAKTPEQARRYQESIGLAFHGYDDDTRELWEIEQVRSFVADLDEMFPYWLFFMKQSPSLQCLLLCFLPPFLTREAKARIFPERINNLLERRWGPAAEQVARSAGLTDAELAALVDRIARYLNGTADG